MLSRASLAVAGGSWVTRVLLSHRPFARWEHELGRGAREDCGRPPRQGQALLRTLPAFAETSLEKPGE